MPRKSVLTPSQKVSLLSFPTSKIEFERYYTLSENDLFIIHQKREIHNRLGFALMLCCIRYPGISYDVDTVIEDNMMEFVKKQLSIQTEIDMQLYFKRETTRREQLAEIQNLYGYRSLNAKMHASYVKASGLNLVASAIILWNTVYIEKAVNYLRQTDENVNEELISNLSPLGWEHINLTGDYPCVNKVLPPDFVAFLIKKVRITIIKALRLFLSHFWVTHVIIVHVCKKKN